METIIGTSIVVPGYALIVGNVIVALSCEIAVPKLIKTTKESNKNVLISFIYCPLNWID